MTAVELSHPVVSKQEWLEARRALLADEKELTRRQDELKRRRRELPWVKVEKSYVFDGPNGEETLAQLFAGRAQLLTYHFMLGPGWDEGCKSCSFIADHMDGMLVHLAHRDTTLVVISRAPYGEIQAFQKRMGWRFKWLSSYSNDFNFDYRVSFTKEEMARGKVDYNFGLQPFPSEEAPGLSAFDRAADGQVFHTYSTYGRGLDILLGTYNFLDLTAKGRDEDGLPYTMAWIRHHDKYDSGESFHLGGSHISEIQLPFGGSVGMSCGHCQRMRSCGCRA